MDTICRPRTDRQCGLYAFEERHTNAWAAFSALPMRPRVLFAYGFRPFGISCPGPSGLGSL